MLQLFKNFTKKAWVFLVINAVLITTSIWLDLLIPDFMATITRTLQSPDGNVETITTQGIYMMLCTLGSLAIAIVTAYCSSYISASFAFTLRSRFFGKVQQLNLAEIKKFSVGSLITRSTNDVNQAYTFILFGIQVIIQAPIMATIAIAKIANKGLDFTLITAIALGLTSTIIIIIIAIVLPKFKIIQKLIDKLNQVARENITGVRVIRAYNAERLQTNKFANVNTTLTNTQLFAQRIMALLSPSISLVLSGLSLSIYWIGAGLINAAGLDQGIELFGNIVVFSTYAMQIIGAFMLLISIFAIYPRARISINRLNEVINAKVSIKDGPIKKDTTKLSGVVEFRNASFKYPGAEGFVFEDISFKTKPGETVAIIGSTGSGKSTLINLIPRFYEATTGSVLVDGVNVKDLSIKYLRDKIGYVAQTAFLFKGTVQYNIGFGSDKPKKKLLPTIKKAAKLAQAKNFIEKMPGKYRGKIAQNGTNISGGQKQRLSIARAIARTPEIYIFDDALSALDYKTEHTLRKELKTEMKDATKFIVSQRIGSIKNADKIIVLDQGRCVGQGTHHELVKKCKVYREIALSQLSKEELEKA